jgi:hypothetical protein
MEEDTYNALSVDNIRAGSAILGDMNKILGE